LAAGFSFWEKYDRVSKDMTAGNEKPEDLQAKILLLEDRL